MTFRGFTFRAFLFFLYVFVYATLEQPINRRSHATVAGNFQGTTNEYFRSVTPLTTTLSPAFAAV